MELSQGIILHIFINVHAEENSLLRGGLFINDIRSGMWHGGYWYWVRCATEIALECLSRYLRSLVSSFCFCKIVGTDLSSDWLPHVCCTLCARTLHLHSCKLRTLPYWTHRWITISYVYKVETFRDNCDVRTCGWGNRLTGTTEAALRRSISREQTPWLHVVGRIQKDQHTQLHTLRGTKANHPKGLRVHT